MGDATDANAGVLPGLSRHRPRPHSRHRTRRRARQPEQGGRLLDNEHFTGEVTISAYDPSAVDLVVDEQGNIVSATPTGPAQHTITGHLTEWFGASDNKQSGVFTVTTDVNGVDETGAPFTLHAVQHANWTPGSEPFAGPPHTVVANGAC
ncbi:MAG: hypothetical protein ACRDWT_09450 [Jatrophihabitantaceae bacterium]